LKTPKKGKKVPKFCKIKIRKSLGVASWLAELVFNVLGTSVNNGSSMIAL
jgi:hypothetical protein